MAKWLRCSSGYLDYFGFSLGENDISQETERDEKANRIWDYIAMPLISNTKQPRGRYYRVQA